MTDTAPPLDLADDQAPPDPERPFVCPECGDAFKGPQYLGSHRAKRHGIPGSSTHKAGGRSEARARATTVNVNLGGKGKTASAKRADPAIEAVRQRAEMVAGMVAVGLMLFGQEADAGDLERGKERWAESVGELAVYEEWLRKLGQGGESSDRLLAWLKFLGATFGLTLPILIRHEAIPPAIINLFSMVTPETVAPPAPPAPPPAEAEAASADVSAAA